MYSLDFFHILCICVYVYVCVAVLVKEKVAINLRVNEECIDKEELKGGDIGEIGWRKENRGAKQLCYN